MLIPIHSTSSLGDSGLQSRVLRRTPVDPSQGFLSPNFTLLREIESHHMPTPAFPLCPPLPSLPGPRNEFLLLSPLGKGSRSQRRRGWHRADWVTICQPPPLAAAQHSGHISCSHCQGQIRCSWRLAPAATVLTSLAPTQTPADSCTPAPLHGTPALPWPGWPQGGAGERSHGPCCLGNNTPYQEEKEVAGKRGPCGWVTVVAQEAAIETFPARLLWGYSLPCPSLLPLQSRRISKPVSPRFSSGSPYSPPPSQADSATPGGWTLAKCFVTTNYSLGLS